MRKLYSTRGARFAVLLATLTFTMPAVARPKAEDVNIMTTPDGVEFGLWGRARDRPAPTLVVLSGNIVDSFTKANFLKAGEQLEPLGYLCVSVDLPCHGKLAKPGYSNLTGWGKRAAAGDDFVAEFNERMSGVLNYLIAEGMADPDKIVMTGTSRGGFLAIRYMAFDPRVAAAVGYAPVTDLRRLKEFAVASDTPGVDDMSLAAHVPALVGRPVWVLIGDRDERVGTDAAVDFMRKLSAAASVADVPSLAELVVVSEPRGHSTPRGTDLRAARWVHRVLEGEELPTP